MSKKKKVIPGKVEKVYCSQCPELLMKLYPYSTVQLPANYKKWICKKCVAKKEEIKNLPF